MTKTDEGPRGGKERFLSLSLLLSSRIIVVEDFKENFVLAIEYDYRHRSRCRLRFLRPLAGNPVTVRCGEGITSLALPIGVNELSLAINGESSSRYKEPSHREWAR